MESQVLVSVILPVRNEAKSLPALLKSLTQQNFPTNDFEIIVADGASTDNTRGIVRTVASQSAVSVALVDNPGIRSGPGRNAGLRVARGKYILFIDGHCYIPSAELLRDMVLLFEQTRAECLCRPQPLLAPTDSRFAAVVAAVRASVLGHGKGSLIYDMSASGLIDPASSGAAYQRSVFAKIGTYDESFDACEDVEFNTRVRKAGMRAYTDPRLAVFYEPRASFSILLKQMRRYGRGRARLMMKHRDCVSAAQTAPAILTVWIAAALLALVTQIHVPIWLRWTVFSPVALYFVIVLLASLGVAMKSGIGLLYQAPAVYLGIHLGLGLGFWTELLRGAVVFIRRGSGSVGKAMLRFSRMLADKVLQVEPRA